MAIEFKTNAQKVCYENVARYIHELCGPSAVAQDEVPVFIVPRGSTLAQTSVFPWGADDATICVRAYVVMNVELTPDLLLYLLQQNNTMRFGAFGIDRDNDIFFEHTICGMTCDKEELRASLMAVAATADKYDDEIIARWGGQTAVAKLACNS